MCHTYSHKALTFIATLDETCKIDCFQVNLVPHSFPVLLLLCDKNTQNIESNTSHAIFAFDQQQ
jgi:hypothetical protein